MSVQSVNDIAKGLANAPSRIIIDKASIANQTAGRYASLWRSTGQPAQGAIPTIADVPTKATTGAFAFINQTAPISSYIAWLFGVSSNSAMSLEIHDRIAHLGGLFLNITTQQNISGLNLGTLAPSADRIGDSNYSDLQWWLEVYTDGGATASNATINVTYHDDTTGNLNVLAVGGTIRAGNMFALTPLIPTAQQGKFIKGINSVTLSASTTVAGNFGFTATKPRTVLPLPLLNFEYVADWSQTNLPEIANDSCLFCVMLPSTTSTGTLRGGGKIIHI